MAVLSRTRVCIKNIPPTTTENELKEFLSKTSLSHEQSLEITDCKVLRNAKGKSRKVAFVGFRREEQAKYVVDHFHRTFLRMSRLSVEPATAKSTTEEKKEDDEKNKDMDEMSSKLKKGRGNQEERSTGAPILISKKKEELLKSIGAGKTTKFWANDEDDYPVPTASAEPVDRDDSSKSDSSDSDDDDDESSTSESSSSDDDEEDTKSSKRHQQHPNQPQPLSDMDFLRSKQTDTQDLSDNDDVKDSTTGHIKSAPSNRTEKSGSSDSSDSDDDSSSEDSTNELENGNDKTKQHIKGDSKTEKDDNHDDESIEEEEEENSFSQTRLFVRNLPFHATEEELETYFSSIGNVMECHIPVDDQRRSKGFAFVSFSTGEDAIAARTQLDKMDFQGRLLHILPARAPPTTSTTAAGPSSEGRNMTWKQRQELARKERETNNKNGGSSKGWSAGFVRGDAVVDNLAERLGLRKGDLLGVKDKLSSGDAAVRLALGETQIIEENREYFRGHGIDMEVLVSANSESDSDIKRSKTGILVKNLPYDTREEELMKLFHVGEAPLKILLPPSRTIALVEYGYPSDAKRAFKKLAYRRFKHVPIYLEWAPLMAKMSSSESSSKDQRQNDATNEKNSQQEKNPQSSLVEDPHETEVAVDEGTVSTTIYVKNLNFRTTESALQEVFETAVGGVRAVRIPKKAAVIRSNEEDNPKLLSMGYGFVELAPPELAKQAINMLQGKLVDGHEWELSVSSKNSHKSSLRSGLANSEKNRTKLMVRNVPFQATRQELLKLFGSFGTLRKVRLPKKFDGTHRGFAFVEFLTAKEAQTAMTSLKSTHLYGRHLVLEWASEDDNDIDKLRDKAKRAAAGVTTSQPKNKRIKFT